MLEAIIQRLRQTYLATPTEYVVKAYLIYYAYICLASIIIPGKNVKGHAEPKRGPQLTYKINGFRLTILTVAIILLFGGIFPELSQLQLFKINALAKQFWPLWSIVNIVAIIVSILLYLKGKLQLRILGQEVDNHTHGSFGLDFWVGKQLNPRIGSFDIKFTAYRVAMIFWLVINLSFLALQYQVQGRITGRMWAYQFTTGFYVLDYFWNQQKMLTTWDIISEQFGYMLVFGDYVFIPFAFSVQSHYLINYPDYDSAYGIAWIIVLYFVGYYIFRTSNSQKNQFKKDPKLKIWGKQPQTIGGKLLVSGFWGIGRHMNYTGDLIMAIAYCLPVGAQFGGYFYAIYLFILLTHRAFRDDSKCRQKYKATWSQYLKRVPYVFIPFKPIDFILNGIGKILYTLTNKQDIKSQ